MTDLFKKVKRILSAFCVGILTVGCLASCTGSGSAQAPVTSEVPGDTGFILYGTYDYDSTDTAILVDKNVEEGTLTFLNTEVGKRYTLGYDGTTGFYDRYGQMVSLSQIAIGEVVDVRFVKSKRHLTLAALSSAIWTKTATDQYVFDSIKREVTIGSDIYRLSDSLFCYSGSDELMYQELNSVDVLTFRGIDNTVLSVSVDKGHGYLRLTGQEYFVGGWIEIGTKFIQKVTEDMLLTVPEGTYNIAVSGSGMTVDRSVTIKKGLETVLDLSDIVPETPKEGLVLFSITPSEATLFIDGEKVDASSAVSLTYGLHQLMCTCDGYHTLTRYLSVGEENAGISITMEKEDKNTSDVSGNGSSDVSGNGQNGNTQSTDTTQVSYYRVFINAPAGAEVYIDGNYVGICPCSFRKTEGSHVVTLSLSGYNTRSYTISVDNSDSDMSFSFTDLEPTNP